MKYLKQLQILTIGILLCVCLSPGLCQTSGNSEENIFVETPSIIYANGVTVIEGTVSNYVQNSSLLIVEICRKSGDSLITSYVDLNDDKFKESFRTGYLTKGEYLVKFTYAISGSLKPSIYETLSFTVEKESEEIAVTGVTLDKSELTLLVGESERLYANVEPATASNPTYTWSSANPSIAKVDKKTGMVTAVSAGKTAITVTTEDGGKTASCNVTVLSNSSAGNIILSNTAMTIHNNGEGSRLSASLSGLSGSDLTWITSNSDVVSFLVGTSFKNTVSGTASVILVGLETGSATITVASSTASATCEITVAEKPADTSKEWYYFYIQFKEDSSAASGTKFSSDAEKGFWLAGYGTNAANALENVCGENGINIMLVTKGALRGWLGTFFGLGDEQQSNGDWKYWSQYKWTGADFSSSGSWSYNNSSLGYYDTGGTFALIRQITSVDGASAGISVKASDCPQELRHDDSSVTVTYDTNGGSTATFIEKVKKGDSVNLSKSAGTKEGYKFMGWNTKSSAVTGLSSLKADSDITLYAVWISASAEVTTTKNPDGSETTTIKDEKQNEDGTTSSITQSTTVKEEKDGSIKTSVDKTETVKNSEGKVQSVIEEKSNETVDANGSVNKQTDKIIKDAEGNNLEETTALELTDKTTGVSTSAEIKKDSAGNIQTSSTSQVELENTGGVAKVDSSVIETVLKQAEKVKAVAAEKDADIEHVLEIETKANQTTESATVEVPTESLSKIAESDVKLKLKTDVGEIEIPPEVAKNLASNEGEKVSLRISKANKEELNDKQQEAVGDSPVFNLSAKSDENEIHELGGTVKITVPYELKEGEDPAKITVWFIDELGNIVKKNSVYNEETKSITFETDHYSLYFIKEDISDPDPVAPPKEDDKKSDSSAIYYAVAVIAVLAVIAATLVILRKKNKL